MCIFTPRPAGLSHGPPCNSKLVKKLQDFTEVVPKTRSSATNEMPVMRQTLGDTELMRVTAKVKPSTAKQMPLSIPDLCLLLF